MAEKRKLKNFYKVILLNHHLHPLNQIQNRQFFLRVQEVGEDLGDHHLELEER